ncbi:hypothetical protein OSB94_17300 [Proteus vulgaris]|uniref:hypothetical protein n=1 Tax=Proteus vulgaris TaxID=585 RepID=UPI001B383B6E|nr:hypothetical protein [Proteus vulgaris]MBQ0215338.1 hypothetical protein [Proteus vulgaris]MDS0789856.1 hypothetical protein [Proteus vulgaris]
MEIYFSILLKKSLNIKELNLNEELVYWGEQSFSQEPKVFKWETLITLTQYECEGFVIDYLFGNTLKLNDFYSYKLELKKTSKNINTIIEFLKLINRNLNEWYFFTFNEDYESYTHKTIMNEKDILISLSELSNNEFKKNLVLMKRKI